jgi:hypothetical protein
VRRCGSPWRTELPFGAEHMIVIHQLDPRSKDTHTTIAINAGGRPAPGRYGALLPAAALSGQPGNLRRFPQW